MPKKAASVEICIDMRDIPRPPRLSCVTCRPAQPERPYAPVVDLCRFDLQCRMENAKAIMQSFGDFCIKSVAGEPGRHDKVGGQRGIVGANRPDVQIMNRFNAGQAALSRVPATPTTLDKHV